MVNAVTLAFAAPLIFGVWYPYPTLHVLEMGRTLCTILGIQFLLAVALPILLIKTNKTKKALAIDWTLIIAIQIAAFLLGFFVLINGRPVAIVFERDRFVVLQANEVVWRSSKGNDHFAIQGSLRGPLLVAVDLQNPNLSSAELIFQSLQGIEPSQREELWTDYASVSKQVLDAAKPATDLRPEDFEKFFTKKNKIFIFIQNFFFAKGHINLLKFNNIARHLLTSADEKDYGKKIIADENQDNR